MSSSDEAARPTTRRMLGVAYGLAGAVAVLDQVSKVILVRTVPYDHAHEVIPGFFWIVHHVNRGAAFGLFQGRMFLLGLVSIAVFAGMIYYLPKLIEGYWERSIACGLVLGGVVGNLVDRFNLIPRPSGLKGVVDFISVDLVVYQWPAFNVADIGITCGVGILLVSLFCRRQPAADADNQTSAAA